MDRQRLFIASVNTLKNRYNFKLSDDDLNFISKQISRLSLDFIINTDAAELVTTTTKVLANMLNKKSNILGQASQVGQVGQASQVGQVGQVDDIARRDISDTLRERIKTESLISKPMNDESSYESVKDILRKNIGRPETVEETISYSKEEKENAQLVNIAEIFGSSQPLRLQNIFNPQATEKKIYLVLDTKHTVGLTDNIQDYKQDATVSSFKWNISTNSISSALTNMVGVSSPIKDIVKIKMYPFIIPNVEYDIYVYERISLAIDELNTQAYSAIDYSRRFHFLFDIEPVNRTGYYPFRLKDLGNSITEFEFFKPIKEISTITLSFGAPFRPISFGSPILVPKQILSNPLSPTQTVIEFYFNPYVSKDSFVYITGFTTTNPSADQYYIELFNDQFGWKNVQWYAVDNGATPTFDERYCIFLDFDITGMVGTPVLTNTQILMGDRRFVVNLEMTMRRSE